MNMEAAHPIQQSEEKLKQLQTQLTGRWAEDAWPMTLVHWGVARERLFHFDFASYSLNIELKYALWYRFEHGGRQQSASQHALFYALQDLKSWLNQAAPTTHSLLERSLESWVSLLHTWLVSQDRYRPHHRKKLNAAQTYYETFSEDKHICLFRVLYRIVASAYDDRPEMEKEIWDLRKLGVPLDLSKSSYRLNFTAISQPWLRVLAKRYLKHNLAVHGVSDCQSILTTLNHFSHFLEEYAPHVQEASMIDRTVIVQYLSVLQAEPRVVSSRNRCLVALRSFLENCVQRLHLPGLPRERLIFDDDFAKMPEYASREIPEEVLVQLRAHLDTLPTTKLRMVTILLEVGMRINELCQLPLDCLICDDKHEWYLQVYQSKVHKEHVIPLVEKHVIGVIQAQQQEIREAWGTACPYLFPSPIDHTKPYRQNTFREALNQWAVKHEIKDRSGKLYHFTAHPFRHTVGMRLINDDVPIEVVSRLLGHASLAMTQIYARVRDKKLRADLERVARKRKTVDYQGHVVKGDARANDPEMQMTRKGIRGQTLPIGGCSRLVVLGECSYANKCLTCPMWLTSTDDLPALKSFYERAIRLKQRAASVGNQVVISQQDHIIPLLAVRIKSLETTEMDGSLCVDDVLASLRSDLAEAESGLEEAREVGLILAVKHLEHAISEIKARIFALEEPA